MELALSLLIAFFVGAIPFGYLAVRILRGQDVRKHGSGNVGATNAARCFPGRSRLVAFFGIYLLDFAKGFLPVHYLGPWAGGDPVLASVLIGLAAVLGHCFSPYLRMRGGKGVATSCGVLCALDPVALAIALGAFALVFAISRIVALGSIALGLALAAASIALHPAEAFGARLPITVLALFLAVFLVWTHRSNLRALRTARTSS